jgi:hypothetical protein
MMLAVQPPQASSVDVVAAFELRCWARARLYAEGEIGPHDAADKLQGDAVRDGLVAAIGQDAVQAIMANAFGPVLERMREREIAEAAAEMEFFIRQGVWEEICGWLEKRPHGERIALKRLMVPR